jgi:ribosomal protein S27E
MPECPICGSVHDSPDGLIQHIVMSRKDGHEGITSRFEASRIVIEAEDDIPKRNVTNDVSDDVTPDDTLQNDMEPEPDGPIFEEPDLNDSPAGGGGSGMEVVRLPCGHESFAKSAAPEPPFSVTCSTCGKTVTIKSYE